MTWNVHGLRDDAAAVRDVLRSGGADVVALQEPPRGPSGRSRLTRLAQSAGFSVAVGGAGARTTALLVRSGLAVTGAQALRLRWHPPRTRRGVSMAHVAGVRVLSVHLSLDEAERAEHLHRILLAVRSAPGGCVVAGDLNEDPGGPTWRRLGLAVHEVSTGTGPTFPARAPRRRIDAVLATTGITATGARRLADERARVASDHLPVVVDLRW